MCEDSRTLLLFFLIILFSFIKFTPRLFAFVSFDPYSSVAVRNGEGEK